VSDDQPCECWDCGGTEFRVLYRDAGNVVECVACGGRRYPEQLYAPDEHGRDYYDVAMSHE